MTDLERAVLAALSDYSGSSTTQVAAAVNATEPVTRRALHQLSAAGLVSSDVIPELHRSKLWWFRTTKGEEDRA